MSQFYRDQDHEEEPLPAVEEAEEPQALEGSIARLSDPAASTSDDTQSRISLLEHLLRSAPLVMPAADFAERVVEAIRHRNMEPFNHDTATGIILGLSSVVVLVLGLLIAVILIIVNIIVHWTDVFQTLLLAVGAVESVVDTLGKGATSSPLMTAITFLSVPLLVVWMWLMRRLAPMEA